MPVEDKTEIIVCLGFCHFYRNIYKSKFSISIQSEATHIVSAIEILDYTGKKMQKIEIQQDYINLVRDSRYNPFAIVGKEEYSIKDFETLIKQHVKMPKEFQISKTVKINYFRNGQIQVYNEYNGRPFEYLIASTIKFDNLGKAPICRYNERKRKRFEVVNEIRKPSGSRIFS